MLSNFGGSDLTVLPPGAIPDPEREVGGLMPDTLRTRIAAVLFTRAMSRLAWSRAWDDLQPEVQQMWLEDADAVISELRLREEQRDLMDGECGQSINYMTGKVTNHYRAATRQHRYVTEWVKDE